ncbi:hypothetical protein O9992_24115 [Vibrio lentus]|nr:hypothetical protein [Vibrio lentus]
MGLTRSGDDVDTIVVLTHQNKSVPRKPRSLILRSARFDEDYEMAGKLKGVDVIFGGHRQWFSLEPCCTSKNRHHQVIGLTLGRGMHLGCILLNLLSILKNTM